MTDPPPSGRPYYQYASIFLILSFLYLFLLLEPLRRGDLLNAINKLAGERGAQKHHHLIRRPLAVTQTYS